MVHCCSIRCSWRTSVFSTPSMVSDSLSRSFVCSARSAANQLHSRGGRCRCRSRGRLCDAKRCSMALNGNGWRSDANRFADHQGRSHSGNTTACYCAAAIDSPGCDCGWQVEEIGRPLELDTDGIWCILPSSFPENFKLTFRETVDEKGVVIKKAYAASPRPHPPSVLLLVLMMLWLLVVGCQWCSRIVVSVFDSEYRCQGQLRESTVSGMCCSVLLYCAAC